MTEKTLTEAEFKALDDVDQVCIMLRASMLAARKQLPACREVSLACTKIEEATHWLYEFRVRREEGEERSATTDTDPTSGLARP